MHVVIRREIGERFEGSESFAIQARAIRYSTYRIRKPIGEKSPCKESRRCLMINRGKSPAASRMAGEHG